MTLPDDLLQNGLLTLTCTPRIPGQDAHLGQDRSCEEQVNGNVTGLVCTPIADHYTLGMEVSGTPKQLRFKLERDGATLVDETVEPSYQETRPNGPGCAPVCRQATVPLVLP